MPGPHHRPREWAAAGGGVLGGCFDETPPAWSTLAPDSPPSKRSGLTSSDDAPRYRRGSKRKPLPPRTPPGLVQPLRRDLRVAFFPHGKHRGYAATSDIPPSTMLFQERPFTVAGAFSNARDALRETARRVAKDARYKHLSMGDDAGEHRNGDTQSGGRANAPSVDAPEPSPFQDEGIDDLTWNDSLKRVTRNARVRVAKKGEDVGGQSDSRSSPTGNDHGGTVSASPPARTQSTQNFVVTLFAHTTTCNHSCAPNAAVSASDDVATLYSLRAISKGEEVTVAYAADTLWLPFDLRRTRIARVFGFLCKCERCAAELENAARERDRGKGVKPQQALKHGVAKNGQTVFDSALNRRTLKNAGFRCWEYGETGFETQFDTEGRLLVETGGGGEGGGTGSNPGTGGKGSWNSDTAGGTRDRRRETNDAASDSSDDSTSTSTLSDSSDDSDDDNLARGGTENGRQSASARYGSENTKGSQQKMTQKQKQTKVLGAHRLYNKLVSAGIGPDHWQMHATRESLVSKLLTPDGRKDFDLDLLLEHANCASRLAPNHPHFVKLVSLVESVYKSNKDVIRAEQFWVWTIELLREAIHPDVLFWNTEFKGLRETRAGGGVGAVGSGR